MPDLFSKANGLDPEDDGRRSHLLAKAKEHLFLAESSIPELETFLTLIRKKSTNPILTGIPSFLRSISNDAKTITQLIPELTAENVPLRKLDKQLDSCFIAITQGSQHWDVLKRCNSFVAMNRNFQGSSRDNRRQKLAGMDLSSREKHQRHKTLKEQGRAEVDVVDWGREWIDVRTLSADRLARQMTDSGWGWGEHERGDVVDAEEWEDVPLARQITRIVAAARMNRHEYVFPRIRVVLPKVSRGNKDIDVLLEQLIRIDPLVNITIEDATSPFLNSPPPPFDEAVQNLMGDEMSLLTQTLNMDHTVLIDLVSDITNLSLEPQPWQAATTVAQIAEEKLHGGLMARTLYPVLQRRELVCTREAAEHFHDVLKTVGTETERRRGRLLVPRDDDTLPKSDASIRGEFCLMSIHPPPPNVQIPIKIIPETWDTPSIATAVAQGRLPGVALDVARYSNFKPPKLSIYVHGWATGMVTVTSNKEISGQIRTLVEDNRRDEGEKGPRIWRVDVTRNLLAKSATPPGGVPQDVVSSGIKGGVEKETV